MKTKKAIVDAAIFELVDAMQKTSFRDEGCWACRENEKILIDAIQKVSEMLLREETDGTKILQ